jgi:Mrp family chromosome partitioning ATPase
MSQNFELLTQLQLEGNVTDPRKPSVDDRAPATKIAPIMSGRASDIGGEEILRLVQRIFLSARAAPPRQVVLCGVDDENGSSSVCERAGRTLAANSSRPVCLVDANVRSPRLSGICGVEGATPFAAPSAPLFEQCVNIGGNLWLAGPNILADDSRVLLPPGQLKERLSQLREEFEYMLIDAPGTSVCADAQLLGLVADATILVIEARITRRLSARRAKELLEAAGVMLLGTVLHNRTFPIPETLYKKL